MAAASPVVDTTTQTGKKKKNMLYELATCSNCTLFLLVIAVRLAMIGLAAFSYYILPLLVVLFSEQWNVLLGLVFYNGSYLDGIRHGRDHFAAHHFASQNQNQNRSFGILSYKQQVYTSEGGQEGLYNITYIQRDLVFDKCMYFYRDPRMSFLSNWDTVHFNFIAENGYSYENIFAFFPLIPLLIRFLHFLFAVPVGPAARAAAAAAAAAAGVGNSTKNSSSDNSSVFWLYSARHFFYELAPVSFYISMLNVFLCGVNAVLLRRIFLYTLLGPEACLPLRPTKLQGKSASSASSARVVAPTEESRAPALPWLHAVLAERLTCGATGSMLDALPYMPVEDAAPPAASQTPSDAALYGRLRVAGGAVFAYLFTPAMIFSVVVYTETIFFFFLLLGIHEQVVYASPFKALWQREQHGEGKRKRHERRWMADMLRCPQRSRNESFCLEDENGEESVTANDANKAQQHVMVEVQWKQQFLSFREMGVCFSFFMAGLSRSNAFFSAGFILYPLFLQLFFPSLYQQRCAIVNAAAYQAAKNKKLRLLWKEKREEKSKSKVSNAQPLRVAVKARYVPTRYPHPLRVLMLVVETLSLFLPYLAMSYVAFNRFILGAAGSMTDLDLPIGRAIQNRNGSIAPERFYQFYSYVQKKYWNVGFMRAYTVTNAPNVLIAVPLIVCLFHFAVCYSGSVWQRSETQKKWTVDGRRRRGHSANNGGDASEEPAHAEANGKGEETEREGATTHATHPSSFSSSVLEKVEPWIHSSNVVYLAVLSVISLFFAHIQVSTRLLGGVPAFFLAIGMQLARHGDSSLSRFILVYMIIWNVLGGVLFPNFMPWT